MVERALQATAPHAYANKKSVDRWATTWARLQRPHALVCSALNFWGLLNQLAHLNPPFHDDRAFLMNSSQCFGAGHFCWLQLQLLCLKATLELELQPAKVPSSETLILPQNENADISGSVKVTIQSQETR